MIIQLDTTGTTAIEEECGGYQVRRIEPCDCERYQIFENSGGAEIDQGKKDGYEGCEAYGIYWN